MDKESKDCVNYKKTFVSYWLFEVCYPDCDSGCRGFESHQPPQQINRL